MRAASWIGLFCVAALALVLAACSATEGSDGQPTESAGNGGPGSGGQGGGLVLTGAGDVGALVIEPAMTTIVVDNGASMPATFSAKLGGQEVFPQKWWVDAAAIGTVDAKGVLTATGKMGGVVKVAAEYDGKLGTASATVLFKKVVVEGNVAQLEQDLLKNAAGTDAEIVWAYPYDRTVWPRGLLGPELMWNNGGAGDYYYFHFVGPFVDVGIFTQIAQLPSSYQMQQDDWVAVSQSGQGGDVDVHVARLKAGTQTATVAIDHKWTMSKGELRGSVYYWSNNVGAILRIKPGASAPENFLTAAGVQQPGQCSTCHTVSADGHTLVIGGDIATSTYDLVNDLQILSIPNVGKQVRNWAMPALSPDGKFLVENNAPLPGPPGGSDGMWDAKTGQKLAGTGLEGALLDMPAFSPKGHKLAFVLHTAPKDLAVYEFDLAGGKVTAGPMSLVPAGGDPQLNTICFPSVSPTIATQEIGEATWIVYHRGNPSSLDTRFGPGDLYVASADKPGLEIRLEQANGDLYPFAAGNRDRNLNYEPTFAPQPAGGYMWIVFTSRRTYGNRLTGSSGSVKQLWMAAIDLVVQPGKDPSHPPFWLPGQDPNVLNMRGYWALDPCIQVGNMCKNDEECCDGAKCENGVCGGPQQCADIGELCNGNADCCDPRAQCIGGICQFAPPQ
jgi:hypothetical protein